MALGSRKEEMLKLELFTVIVILDGFGGGAGVGLEHVALFELVDGDVEAGAEEDGYADLVGGLVGVGRWRGGVGYH